MDILKHSMTLAGISQEAQDTILNNEALKGITIPDEVTTKVKNSILSLEGAKNHPDISNHFKGTHFGVIDSATKQALSEGGFTDEEINTIFDGKKTAERLKLAISQTAIKAREKAGQSGSAQLDELRETLKQAQANSEVEKADFQALISKQKAQFEGLQYSQALRGAISDSGLKMVALPADVLQVSSNHLIQQKLNELGAIAKAVDGKIKLFRTDNTEQEHYSGAEPTDFYKLLPTVLESLIEKRNDPTKTKTGVVLESSNKTRSGRARQATLNSILNGK